MTNHIYVIESKDPETGIWSMWWTDAFYTEEKAKAVMTYEADTADDELRVAKYTREEAR